MLKTSLCFYFLFITSNVYISGEQFQACDSSSDKEASEEILNGDDLRDEMMRMKEAIKQPNQNGFYIPTNIQLPCRTQYFAQITWPSGASIRAGGIVKYNDILEAPKIIWPCHGSKLYGLVFANIDAVLTSVVKNDEIDKDWKEYLWFKYNIPGSKIEQGIEVKSYRPPSMEKGSCRIVVVIHEQTQRIDIGNKDNSEWVADKAFFEVFKTFNGTLVAGNMFTVENSRTMRKLLCWLYILLTGIIVSTWGEQFQVADSSNEDGSSFKGIDDKVMESFKTELEKLKTLTENGACTTKYFAKVTWPSGASPAIGDKVKYKDVLVKPKVIWPCYGSKLYGMVFADLEALLTPDPMAREHLWFVYNIPGNQVDRGIEVVSYRPPAMKKDSYRVMVMIHEQNKPVEVDVANLDEGARADKVMIAAFASFNGTLTAGNMFIVEK